MSKLAGSVNVSSHLCLISPQQQTKLNFQRKYHQNRSPSEGVPADSEGPGQARRTFWSEQSRATSEHHHAPHGERHPPPRQPHQDPDPTEQPALRGVHRGRAENYLNLIEKIAFGMKIAANNSKCVKLVEFWISPAIFSPKNAFSSKYSSLHWGQHRGGQEHDAEVLREVQVTNQTETDQ